MTFQFYRILCCDTVWPGNNIPSSQMKVLTEWVAANCHPSLMRVYQVFKLRFSPDFWTVPPPSSWHLMQETESASNDRSIYLQMWMTLACSTETSANLCYSMRRHVPEARNVQTQQYMHPPFPTNIALSCLLKSLFRTCHLNPVGHTRISTCALCNFCVKVTLILLYRRLTLTCIILRACELVWRK